MRPRLTCANNLKNSRARGNLRKGSRRTVNTLKPKTTKPPSPYDTLQISQNQGEGDGMNVFDEMGNYWAEIADRDQTERQVQFLKGTLKADGWVLDVACGTGRHIIPLGKAGYNVVGLDISARLLGIAKTRWRNAQLVRADMRFLPFKTKAFSAAVSMDTSFGYLPSEEEDAKTLKECRRTLKQNGVLIVDVFNRKNLMAKYQKNSSQPKWKEYPSFFLLQKRSVSQTGEWLCDSWTTRDKASGKLRRFEHTVRLYEEFGLRGLLEKAHFAIKGVWGGYEGQAFSADSSRLIFLAAA
jgi:SAM-dependent methyltransferase